MDSFNKIKQQEWVEAGIKHEIFMRVFPSLRHGLVSPISIARMSVSIVKRLLARGEESKVKLSDPVERMDQQLAEAVVGIRALQAWEPGANNMAMPSEILQQGVALMTSPLALRNIKLDYVPADIQDLDEVPHQLFLYSWLGLLCYFQDSLSKPAILRIEQKEPKSVCIHVTRPLYDANQLKEKTNEYTQVIDKAALDILVSRANLQLVVKDKWVSLGWA